jgi:hypothetical protein
MRHRVCGTLSLLWVIALGGTAGGCATIRVTDPPRTATEQMLMSEAVNRSIAQLNFDALRDRKVWVETAYLSGAEQVTVGGEVRQRLFTSAEQAFATGVVRERLLQSGARLVQEKKEADVVLEVRSGGIGIDRIENLVGIPAGVFSGTEGPGGLPLATPELAILKTTRQRGFASLAFVAYRVDTGELVTASGPYVGRTLREDWWIFGTGPRTVGNIPTTEQQR